MKSSRLMRVHHEAVLLAREYGEAAYDDEDGRWVHILSFRLPAGWDRRTAELLFDLPSGYPHVPPNGFYIDRFLRTRSGRSVSHYFEERSGYNPYADKGWGWFCIHLNPKAWSPASDVLHGDNLLKLTTLIQAILGEVVTP